MAHAPNHRLAKIHRGNTVEVVATLYGGRHNTGREGRGRGLRTMDDNQPVLMLGRALAACLRARRLKHTRPCQPGELYGVRGRIPRDPTGETVEYQPVPAAPGHRLGICHHGESVMDCRVNPERPHPVRGTLTATVPEGVAKYDLLQEIAEAITWHPGLPVVIEWLARPTSALVDRCGTALFANTGQESSV